MLGFVLPPDTSIPLEVEIKNKRENKVSGQWGWYYPSQKRVVVYVPREITRTYKYVRPKSKSTIHLSSRAEFLLTVLAHEVRHHYQYEHWNTEKGKWRLANDRLGRLAKEVDAELYEVTMLNRWRESLRPPRANIA